MARLEFFYDYGSPFSYLIDTQLPALCERTGAERVYRPMLLGGVFKAAGLVILEATADPAIKQELRANTDEAVERGAFGAPTFFVGDEMFFGNDHVPFLERALAGRSA
jgi:2-hydroxychromene-2-carboxylate isomerase